MTSGVAWLALIAVLQEAQRRGFLGDGPVEPAAHHAAGFAAAADLVPHRAVDLGSGGGLPGLVLALMWPDSRWSLVDSQARRCAFLGEAVATLNLGARVEVVHDRAERVGRATEHRASYDLAVARGFGPPAVVAECAAPLLTVGGTLVVSEPPGGDPGRWPAEGLRTLGLVADATVVLEASYQRLRQLEACPERFPRRPGVPTKRPLF